MDRVSNKKFDKYSVYKDSTVEWLEKVPKDWANNKT